MSARFALVLLALLPAGCATWTQPTESVDLAPPGRWAIGGGIGVSPATASRRANFPAGTSAGHEGTAYASVRRGVTSNVEFTLDAAYLVAALSAHPRVRARWLDRESDGARYSGVSALGIFGGLANVDDASSAPPVTYKHESVRGLSLSSSFGRSAGDWQVYAGPRAAWIRWDASYGPTSTTSLAWNGWVPGAFAGVAYRWPREHGALQLDLMASVFSLPANLVDAEPAAWPGLRASIQWIPARE